MPDPVSIVAQPITNESLTLAAQKIPDVMKLDPWFDWHVFLGLPFWFFVDIFFCLIVITVILYWIFRMKRLASVRGYVDVMKQAKPTDEMVWIINATRRLTIECMKMTDGVLSFYDPVNIMRWYHDEKIPPLNIGGYGGVLCSEGYFRSRDMVAEIARDDACDIFNANLNDYTCKLNNPCNPITDYNDYKKFGKELLEQCHPDGLSISSFAQFNPERDNKYKPTGLTARFNGGIFVRQSRRLNLGMKVMGWLEKHLALGIVVTLGLIAIVAAWMVPLT